MPTKYKLLKVVGHSGAAILRAGMGLGRRDIHKDLVKAGVLAEALTLLKENIAEGQEPWEFCYGRNFGSPTRKDYEAAIEELSNEADKLFTSARDEDTWDRITRRNHHREILELCYKRAQERGTQERVLP